MQKRKSFFLLFFPFLFMLWATACSRAADSPAPENRTEEAPTQEAAEKSGHIGVTPETETADLPGTAQPEPQPETTLAEGKTEEAAQSVYALPETDAASAIGDDEALSIALEHAGLSETDISWLRIELEYEEHIARYDVKFYAGNMEYDYEINAADGQILGFDQEWDDDHHAADHHDHPAAGQSGETARTEGSFGRDEAVALALSRMPGATEADIVSFKIDDDDGKKIYEIEIRYNGSELELEIDANTGAILEMDYDH